MGFSRQEYWSGEPLPSPCAYLCCHKWKDFLLFKGWICSIICILLWFFFKFALVKWSIRWADVQQQTRREIEIEVYYSQVLEVFGKPRGTTKKAMATHSSTLAWKIPRAEEPGRLQSMGSWRVRHDWVTALSLFTFMHWRRKWQPTPVFLPEESQGPGSLVDCRLWGRTESDTTEVTQQQQPVFLPGESQEQRSLVNCHLWGRTESDRTKVT